MSLNFDKQISDISRQINSYIKKGTVIPNKLLDYYNNLLNANQSQANLSILNALTYSNFTDLLVVVPNNNIGFISFQNNGSSDIYFGPLVSGINLPLSKYNSLVLSPGANWNTDRKEFIKSGLGATADVSAGSILIVYYT